MYKNDIANTRINSIAKKEIKILGAIADYPGSSIAEISRITEVSESHTRSIVYQYIEDKIIFSQTVKGKVTLYLSEIEQLVR